MMMANVMNEALMNVGDAGLSATLATVVFGSVTLWHYIFVASVLFTIGLVGFVSRRNMIVMFLCTELMFQAAGIAMIAFGRYHLDVSGQVFVIFILTVAAAEAALALALVVLLYRRKETLNAEAWSELRD